MKPLKVCWAGKRLIQTEMCAGRVGDEAWQLLRLNCEHELPEERAGPCQFLPNCKATMLGLFGP